MKGKIKKIKQSKEQWVWAFYEIDIKHTDTILRGIATNSKVKKRFEISLKEEFKIRKTENKWTCEKILLDHLYAHTMYDKIGVFMVYKTRKQLDGE